MAGRQNDEQARMMRRILRLMRRGLLTVADAALVAQVSKKTVQRWCDGAGIDPQQARWRYIIALKHAAEQECAGNGPRDDAPRSYSPRTGPSRAQLQRIADHANKSFRSRSKKMRDPC